MKKISISSGYIFDVASRRQSYWEKRYSQWRKTIFEEIIAVVQACQLGFWRRGL